MALLQISSSATAPFRLICVMSYGMQPSKFIVMIVAIVAKAFMFVGAVVTQGRAAVAAGLETTGIGNPVTILAFHH